MSTPSPVEFLRYKGQAFKIGALTLSQQEELAAYLRFVYLDEMKKHVDGLPLKMFQYAWDKATAKAENIYPGRREHAEAFFTPQGISYALHLAAQKYNQGFTQDQAFEVIDEVGEGAYTAVASAAGFRSDGSSKVENKALPVAEIIHVLCNEPYCKTATEVRAMTLDEIALIWCKPQDASPIYTQSDLQEWLAQAAEQADKRKLGIWGEESPW